MIINLNKSTFLFEKTVRQELKLKTIASEFNSVRDHKDEELLATCLILIHKYSHEYEWPEGIEINDGAKINELFGYKDKLLKGHANEEQYLQICIDEKPSEFSVFTIAITRGEQNLIIEVHYDASIDKEIAQNILSHYIRIFQQLNDKETVGDINIFGKEEYNKIIYDWNRTEAPYPKDKTIHQLFEEQVERTPDNIAVSCSIDYKSYKEELLIQGITNKSFSLLNCYLKLSELWHKIQIDNSCLLYDFIEEEDKKKFICLSGGNNSRTIFINTSVADLLGRFKKGNYLGDIYRKCYSTLSSFVIYQVCVSETETKIEVKKYRYDINNNLGSYLLLIKILYGIGIIEFADVENIYFYHKEFEDLIKLHSKANISSINNVLTSGYTPKELFIKRKNEDIILFGDTTGCATTGVAYLASYLRRNGINACCQLYDPCIDNLSLEENIKTIVNIFNPQFVGISMKWFPHIARVIKISELIKKHSSKTKVIIGGNTASYYHDELIKYETVDYVVRGDGEKPLLAICRRSDYLPNTTYRINGKILSNPIDYVQDANNSSDVYLSDLDEIFISKLDYLSIASKFFIPVGKGCSMNCCYCGGCRSAQDKTFNRKIPFMRRIEDVRRDIDSIKDHTSTLFFDFDVPGSKSINYYQELWEGINLTEHFCSFYFWELPDKGFLKLISTTFKYSEINVDMCSLSEKHRQLLVSKKMVKPQPTDSELFRFLDEVEKYKNIKIRIDIISGLPYFTEEDCLISEDVFKYINSYPCFIGLEWGRLHAQPGAPIVDDAESYSMRSFAKGFKDFLDYSQKNYNENKYPTLETCHYPFIYFNDDKLNSKITSHYIAISELASKSKGSYNSVLSYKELNERSNQLAHTIRKEYKEHWGLEVNGDTLIGIYIERSLEMIIGILGILKAGGAYVPFDSADPEERLKFKIKDCGCKMVLTSSKSIEDLLFLTEEDTLPLSIDSYWEEISKESKENPSLINKSTDLAYVIYTSGSTGMPKGVMIEHSGISNLIIAQGKAFEVYPVDKCLQFASIAFDAAVSEIFVTLLKGATLYIASTELKTSTDSIYDYMLINKITVTTLPPVLLKLIPKKKLKHLKTLIVAGDVCDEENMRFWSDEIFFINAYGPTEITVCATFHRYKLGDTNINIGKPIFNTACYILSEILQPVPIGVSGELYIGGDGLARGYLNRPELTAERFIPNPFASEEDKVRVRNLRLYKTGDLCRWLPDGNIEYIGRNDFQVKIRGFRIELGEIEAQMQKIPGISQAVVITREYPNGDKYLAGYYTQDKNIKKSKDKKEQKKTVGVWKQLYDNNYDDIEQVEFGEVFQGWKSSYTDEDIPLEEMREWRDDTVVQIMQLRPRRVIEVGCGSGLLLVKLALNVLEYVGIDFSKQAIRLIERQIKGTQLENKVKLYVAVADKITETVSGKYDCIVINSVIQYFPDIEYLSDVIQQCFKKLENNGKLYIGDIRSYSLLDEYHSSVEFFKSEESKSAEKIIIGINHQKEIENELLVSPQYFFNLKSDISDISDIEILAKNCNAVNELTKYRYTAILHKNRKNEVDKQKTEFEWSVKERKNIEKAINEKEFETIVINSVPNVKLKKDFELKTLLTANNNATKMELLKRQGLSELEDVAWSMCRLGESNGYKVKIYWQDHRKTNGYTLVFYTGIDYVHSQSMCIKKGETISNIPNVSDETSKKIRTALSKALPNYMVPSQLVCLENMPLNTSGKIDRKNLPKIEFAGDISKYVAPRAELEKQLCAIWSSVLSVDEAKIGIHDKFFNLGGNSLSVIRLVAQIERETGKRLKAHELFSNATIEKQALLLGEIKQSEYRSLAKSEKKDDYSVGGAQNRMYLTNKIEGNSTAYNISLIYEVAGKIEISKLKDALKAIAENQESLRTYFIETEQGIRQKIADFSNFGLEIEEKSIKTEGINVAISEFIRPFYLNKAPLWRVGVYRIQDKNESLLLFDFHHIIFDGQSAEIFISEFKKAYEGKEVTVPEAQYRDSSESEESFRRSAGYREQEQYWLNELGGSLPALELPSDRPRPKTKSYSGAAIKIEIPVAITTKIRLAEKKVGTTAFVTMLAAYNILLSKYSGQEDIIVGIPTLGRKHSEIMRTIGMFVGTLPIRTTPSGIKTVAEYLWEVREKVLDAISAEEYPFEEMVSKLNVPRESSRHPVFDVMFALWENDERQFSIDNAEFKRLEPETTQEKFDLAGYVYEFGDRSEIVFSYATDLFNRDTIERLGWHYVNILSAMVSDSDKQIKNINILSEQEYRTIVYDWNRTEAPYPKDKTIHQLFEEQVERTPDNIAVVFEDKQLTYRELNEKSNQLAHCIRHEYKEYWEAEVKGDTLIGIYVERSLEMIIGILGILKAGGAYVPFDSADPEERLKFKIADSGCKVVLTSSKSVEDLLFLTDTDILPLSIDSYWGKISKFPSTNLVHINKSTDLAYVIYTSGSTGQPKGVMIEHKNINNLISDRTGKYKLLDGEKILLFNSIAFDASMEQIYLALFSGASLHVIRMKNLLDTEYLENYLVEKKITHLDVAPIFLSFLNAEKKYSLRRVVVGGDVCHKEIALKWNKHFIFYNNYGPTETTINACSSMYSQGEVKNKVTIGKPLNNYKLYILDAFLQPVPIGVSGELYIGGDGLARGYLNRSKLTEERFISNPFSTKEEKFQGRNLLIYKTGDLVRLLPDRNIEFLGRNDNQIKIRGYRVELGEIKSKLLEYPLVSEAEVFLDDLYMKKELSAYIKLNNLCTITSIDGDRYKLYLYSQIPYLKSEIDKTHADTWPEYFYYDEINMLFWPKIYIKYPNYQFTILNETGDIVAVGNTVPIYWDGECNTLPKGWDEGIKLAFNSEKAKQNTLLVLAGVVKKSQQNKGISNIILKSFKLLAKFHHYKKIIVPVRPTGKHRYPDLPIEEYCNKKDVNGYFTDDWLRVHQKNGGKVLRIEPKSQYIIAPIGKWEQWIGKSIEESGLYYYKDCLQKINIDIDKGTGEYFDPCVWVEHDSENEIYASSLGVDSDSIKKNLSKMIPTYMLPDKIIIVDKFPLNTSGKIDRKKLPEVNIIISQEYIPPASEVEKMISKIWGKMLNLEKISIKDSFFSVGGNSLNAIKLATEISKVFLRYVPVVTIFQKKTIEEQAREIARLIVTPSEDIVYLKNNESYKETLILFPPGYSGAEAYYELVGKLDPNIRVIGLNNYFINNPDSDFADAEAVLKLYLEQLESKSVFNDSKPVSLGGWSLGGNLSLSALRLLKKRDIKAVFLFDAVLEEKNELIHTNELNSENPDDPDNSFFARFKDAGYSREQIIAMIGKVKKAMISLKYEKVNSKIILFKAYQEAMGIKIKDEFNGWGKYYKNIEKIDLQSVHHFNILSNSESIGVISNTINVLLKK